MLTAVMPVYIKENMFWSSDRGIACIDGFLSWLATISEIDRMFILSPDDQVGQLAKTHNLKVLHSKDFEAVNGQYTFAQIVDMAKNVIRISPDSIEDLTIVDHRNLLLTPNDFMKALNIYRQHSQAGVISLTPCQDHPCQFRSYSTYVGCNIFHFQGKQPYCTSNGAPLPGSKQTIESTRSDLKNITLTVHFKNQSWGFEISCLTPIPQGLIAYVLPFTDEGPLYNKFCELCISTAKTAFSLELENNILGGVIVTFVVADSSGIYDTVECFTPENADWELGAFGSMVVDKNNHLPIQGRQQFSPVYSYDGSIFIVNASRLHPAEEMNPVPVILNRSCIVTDWVDYLRFDSKEL